MAELHLVADDLTGALDSAGAFARPDAPVQVRWFPVPAAGTPSAYSTETRDRSADLASRRATLAGDAARQATLAGSLIFKKIDSLLRGHVALELAAFCERLQPDRVVLAPAHPALGRITRGTRQYARRVDGQLDPVPVPLMEQLQAHGFSSDDRGGNDPRLVWAEAESEADLDAVVAREKALGRSVLWCGSGGLAQALAGPRQGFLAVPRGRTLAIIGSDHPVANSQVAAIASQDPDVVIAWRESDRATDLGVAVERRLSEHQLAVLVPSLGERARDDAARAIAAMLAALLETLLRPDVLFCSGGETLRVVCDALTADGLACEGFVAEGVPLSRLRGGRWPSLPVMSKSGAFGSPAAVAELLCRMPNPPPRRDRR